MHFFGFCNICWVLVVFELHSLGLDVGVLSRNPNLHLVEIEWTRFYVKLPSPSYNAHWHNCQLSDSVLVISLSPLVQLLQTFVAYWGRHANAFDWFKTIQSKKQG